MPTLKILSQDNMEVGQMELLPEVFEIPVRPEILHLLVRQHLAAKRSGTHQVKTRSFVSGGGHKPWRQKGTGRARAGSNRSPIWRHGAIVHGPQPRDYSFKINKRVRQLGLKMALSAKLLESSMVLVDKLELPQIKTKLFSQVAGSLGLKKALIVLKDSDNNVELSARNLPGFKVVRQDQLNVYDVLGHTQLVMTSEAAQLVQERLK